MNEPTNPGCGCTARDGAAPPAAGQAAAEPNAQQQSEPNAEQLAELRAGAVAGVVDLQQLRRQPTKVSQRKVDQVKVGSMLLPPVVVCQ